jgi:hypothetical protein
MVDLKEIKEILQENIKKCDELLASNVEFINEVFNKQENKTVVVRFD